MVVGGHERRVGGLAGGVPPVGWGDGRSCGERSGVEGRGPCAAYSRAGPGRPGAACRGGRGFLRGRVVRACGGPSSAVGRSRPEVAGRAVRQARAATPGAPTARGRLSVRLAGVTVPPVYGRHSSRWSGCPAYDWARTRSAWARPAGRGPEGAMVRIEKGAPFAMLVRRMPGAPGRPLASGTSRVRLPEAAAPPRSPAPVSSARCPVRRLRSVPAVRPSPAASPRCGPRRWRGGGGSRGVGVR